MDEPSFIIAITGLLLAVSGVIGTFINSRITARKNELDAVAAKQKNDAEKQKSELDAVTSRLQASIDQAIKDNDKLRTRLDDVEADNLELRAIIRTMEAERRSNLKRIEVLEDQVAALEDQLIKAGITPVTRKADK